MRRASDVPFLTAFGIALWVTAAWLFMKPAIDLSLKSGRALRIAGVGQVFFSSGPLLAGLALFLAAWRVMKGGELRPDTITNLEACCFLCGIAALIAGIFSGVKV